MEFGKAIKKRRCNKGKGMSGGGRDKRRMEQVSEKDRKIRKRKQHKDRKTGKRTVNKIREEGGKS